MLVNCYLLIFIVDLTPVKQLESSKVKSCHLLSSEIYCNFSHASKYFYRHKFSADIFSNSYSQDISGKESLPFFRSRVIKYSACKGGNYISVLCCRDRFS